MRRNTLFTAVLVSSFLVCLPAAAQGSGFSIGLGVSGGVISADGTPDLDISGVTLLGRWQHGNNGWGAMAEIRDGEDNETFVDFDYTQVNLYGTYTWLRSGIARPFVKAGVSNTDVEFTGGPGEDDSALILGGGVEVGRGRWAFHASVDVTEPELGTVDSQTGNLTLGAVFRF